MACALAARLRCVSITPLGMPVVPEVYISSATASGSGRRRIGRGIGFSRQRLGFRIDHDQRHRPVEGLHHLAHARFPLGRHADHAAVGVREHIAHLLGLRQQVDRVHAVARVHRTQQQAQRLQAVGHDDGDRLARLGTVPGQHPATRRQPRASSP
jgi:hypothetical protein